MTTETKTPREHIEGILAQTTPGTALHESCRRTLVDFESLDPRSQDRDADILLRRFMRHLGRVPNP